MALKLQDPNTNVQGAVRELQGYTVTLLAGAAIDTKIDVAAIREEDTILSVIHNTAGTLADLTSEAYVFDIKATGTAALASLVAGDQVVISGKIFQAVTGTTPGNGGEGSAGTWYFGIGANDTESGENLAAVVNHRFGLIPGGVTATESTGTVTLKAVQEGTVGNAITLTESTSGARITLSAATLTGGTNTGGIALDTTDTTGDQLLVSWYNRK